MSRACSHLLDSFSKIAGTSDRTLDFSQPGVAPENRAGLLAAIMREAGAAQVFEEDNVILRKSAHRRALAVVASLDYALGDFESAAAELHHLRHEGETVERAIAVECLENFAGRADFDKVPGPEV